MPYLPQKLKTFIHPFVRTVPWRILVYVMTIGECGRASMWAC